MTRLRPRRPLTLRPSDLCVRAAPRTVDRLASFTPLCPLPKLFRLTRNGRLMEDLFEGSTINTPPMLCLEDYLSARAFIDSVGGLEGTIARSDANAKVIAAWVARTPWVFVARAPETRSSTSACLKIIDPDVLALPKSVRPDVPRRIAALLDAENVARTSRPTAWRRPACASGPAPTVEQSDVEALMPLLDWAFAQVKQSLAIAA